MINLPLTYFPAYVGLYISLILAITCNAYLDIQFGLFEVEVWVWAAIFALTLSVGWLQKGETLTWGKFWQKGLFILAVIATIFVFLPIWGVPRAGLFTLAMLQASLNCITTTHRHLQVGLVVSIVMVMFAVSHYRADWTMLFYLIPFVIAVIFTMVAAQVSRHIEISRNQSINKATNGFALPILSAVMFITVLSGLIYIITPSIKEHSLSWQFGVPINSGNTGENEQNNSAKGSMGSDTTGSQLISGEIRKAAARPGIPDWQEKAIHVLADAYESAELFSQSLRENATSLWQMIKEWLEENIRTLVFLILLLLSSVLLITLCSLIYDKEIGLWLMTRFDFIWIVVLRQNTQGQHSAIRLYKAMTRLFALKNLPLLKNMDSRQYLNLLCNKRYDLQDELTEMTRLFEYSRYSPSLPSKLELSQMRLLYGHLYKNIDKQYW